MSSSRAKTLGDIALLAAANLFFFFNTIFVNRFLYSTSEFLSNFYPLYQYTGSCLRKGLLPLWDPYFYFSYAGISFPGVFYPFNLLASFLASFSDLNGAFVVVLADVVFHFFLASVFMYALIRYLTTQRTAALIAAMAFAYCGFVTKSLQALVILHTLVWWPLTFLFFIRALHQRPVFAIFAGLTLGISLLAGYLALSLYMCVVLLLYALWHSVITATSSSGKERFVEALRVTAPRVMTVFGVAIGIAAPQLLATAEYARLSVRAGAAYEHLVMWGSVQPLHFITLLLPHFFGGAGTTYWGQDFVAGLTFPEAVYYCGIFLPVFGLIGLLITADSKRISALQQFLLLLILLSLFMMMGHYSAVFGMYYAFGILPLSRIPARWAFFVDFALVVLGGIGLAGLLQPLPQSFRQRLNLFWEQWIRPVRRVMIFGLLPLLIALAVRGYWQSIRSIIHFLLFGSCALWFIWRVLKDKLTNKIVVSLVVVVFLDLFFASARINPAVPGAQPAVAPEEAFGRNALVSFLKTDKDIYRVSGLEWPLLQGQTNRIFAMGYLGGFSYGRFARFRGEHDPMGSGGHSWLNPELDAQSQVIDFYNLKYLMFPHDLAGSFPDHYEAVAGLAHVYRNKRVFPRAFFVYEFETMPDTPFILERMRQIDLARQVILEQEPGFISRPSPEPSSVRITDYQEQRITLEATVAQEGLVVTSEVYYPGWKAYVDGQPAKLLRANYVFRAVRVPAGRHTVSFIYAPWWFIPGVVVFVLTVVLMLFVSLNAYRTHVSKNA